MISFADKVLAEEGELGSNGSEFTVREYGER